MVNWNELEKTVDEAAHRVKLAIERAKMQERSGVEAERDPAGEYGEAVEMFTDGIVADILSGHLTTREQVLRQLEENVEQERYVKDDVLASEVLLYSEHPTYGIWMCGVRGGASWSGGKEPFPLKTMASAAFSADVLSKLITVPAYQQLPVANVNSACTDGDKP